jgi:tRNA (guanine6-N2)-methyltransferase
MPQSFYVMTMPGLETLAFSEIRAHFPQAELIKFARGLAQFRLNAPPGDLLKLRTTEDAFLTVARITGLGNTHDALRVIHSATTRADIPDALSQWQRLHNGQRIRSWRVVSQMHGAHAFQRNEAGRAVSDALRRLLPRSMRLVEDEADVEFWLLVSGSEALVGLRLTDATMRHRDYKREHLPASLRPTVAAAMSWLAHPMPDDVVLDPLCGVGTILIERALLAPYKRAFGGDIREEAVTMAKRNARSAKISAQWQTWDARALPLEDGSVTKIITNLPFGKQIGSHEANVEQYSTLAREFGRVLVPDGMMVTLTSEDRLWETVLRDRGWSISKKFVLVLLGQPASIFVAERRRT